MKSRISHVILNHWRSGGKHGDNPIMVNTHFPPHHIHICPCWRMHTNNLLLFFGVCLSILEMLGFKYCKWIIYICTVYNFKVHEKDDQRLILVMKKKILLQNIYIKRYVSIFLMNRCLLSSLISIPNEVLRQALQNFSAALFG